MQDLWDKIARLETERDDLEREVEVNEPYLKALETLVEIAKRYDQCVMDHSAGRLHGHRIRYLCEALAAVGKAKPED